MTKKTKSLESDRRVLNTTGLRVTNQRALILDIIRRGHLDADEIYRQAQAKHPRLSLSTVYRTLQVLKKRDLVKELHFDETHHHYEAKPSSEHHHLVCFGCGKIVEFKCSLSSKLKGDIARENNFKITNIEIRMTGYCSNCRNSTK